MFPAANSPTGFALQHTGTDTKKQEHVFVYGTLKRGMWNHHKMGDSELVAQASVPGKLYDMGLPCYIMGDEGTVLGELYLVEQDKLKALDYFEGYRESAPESSFYLRSRVTCTTVDGKKIDAWVYEYNGEVSENKRLNLGVF